MSSSLVLKREILSRTWFVVALLLAIKLIGLWLDPVPRFFLGDSASYVHAALTDWFPSDRSFTYPKWVFRSTAVASGSIYALVFVQTLCGVISAWLLYFLMRRFGKVSAGLALIFARLFAAEPAQLFSERTVMAETLGGLAFLAFLATLLQFCRDGRWGWIPLFVGLGLLAISFRMNLLPAILASSLLAPMLRWLLNLGRPGRFNVRSGHLLALSLVVLSTAGGHHLYKAFVGASIEGRPSYIGAEGRMRLGLIAPLVRPGHLIAAGIDPALLDQLEPPLTDHRARESHIWHEFGLVRLIEANYPGVDRLASKVAVRAFQDDRWGLIRLGWLTTADYFNAEVTAPRMHDDLATRALPDTLLQALEKHFAFDGSQQHQRFGLVARYFSASTVWLTACYFLLPLLCLLGLYKQRSRLAGSDGAVVLMMVLLSLGLVLSQFLFSHIVSFRYLHLFPAFCLYWVAVLVCRAGYVADAPRAP